MNLSVKPRVNQNIAVHALHAAKKSAFLLCFVLLLLLLFGGGGGGKGLCVGGRGVVHFVAGHLATYSDAVAFLSSCYMRP